MSFENNRAAFRSWLTLNRNMKATSIGDYASHCSRIERVLRISLDDWVTLESGLQAVLDRIEREIPDKKSQGSLKTAAKAYADFLQSARKSSEVT